MKKYVVLITLLLSLISLSEGAFAKSRITVNLSFGEPVYYPVEEYVYVKRHRSPRRAHYRKHYRSHHYYDDRYYDGHYDRYCRYYYTPRYYTPYYYEAPRPYYSPYWDYYDYYGW